MAGNKWIAEAIERPGAFTRKAKRRGKSVKEYEKEVTKPGSRASTRTKRQANLSKTLRKFH